MHNPMLISRRELFAASAGMLPALLGAHAAEAKVRARLGLVIHSVPIRIAREKQGGEPVSMPSKFLAHTHALGVDGVQVGLGKLSEAEAGALREQAETTSMFLEGIVGLPRDDGDVPRFEAEIRATRRAGATIIRSVMLSGRRYETFSTAAAFKRFTETSSHSLSLAAPVAAREGIKLAVENHKDYRADELIALLKKIGNDHVGVCLDIGNNIALLEDPNEVVEALAPLAFSTHIKDMGVEESRDGFLLSEVSLGTGVLDLPRMARAVRPEVHLNIEMITRDPLSIPCLADRYWETFADLPARHLARTLSWVRSHPAKRPLDRVSSMPLEAQLKLEDENLRRCIAFAREQL